MKLSQEKLIQVLEKKFKLDFVTDGGIFSSSNEGSIWISAENGELASDGRILFDYYTEYNDYFFGIHPEFEAFVEDAGWYCSWNDAGTLFLYEN
jgi:hypothetical protein